MEISINTATCKKFLTSTGMRASKEGIIEFQKVCNVACNNVAEKAAACATTHKRKTIMPSDIQEVLAGEQQ